MSTIAMMLYIVIGVILAVPYCLLAGWSFDAYILVSLCLPVSLVFWIILAGLAGVFKDKGSWLPQISWRSFFRLREKDDPWKKSTTGFRIMLWIITFLIFLPIITHWISELLSLIGYNQAGDFLYVFRYKSPLVVIAGMLVIFIFFIIIRSLVFLGKTRKFRKVS